MSGTNSSLLIELPADDGASPIQPGAYTVRLLDIEHVPPNLEKEYKAAYKFIFEVSEGEHAGKKVYRSCSISGGPKAELPRFVSSLLGHKPTSGQIDLASCREGFYMAFVAASPQGKGVRVESLARKV